MKAIKARANDDHHIVVGISNIDVQIQQALTDMSIRTKRTSSDIY